jgi:hypothetical protein
VTARYGSAIHSVAIEVLPDPPLSTDLVIDSFYVVEYRDICVASDCPYLVYTPTFQLRAANGAAPVRLQGVEMTIGSRPKFICKDDVPFLPGQSRRFSGVDPYLWNNPLVLVSRDAKPIFEDTASLRLFVQGADGSYSVVGSSGPIHRESPLTDTPGLPTWEWSC